ncbi:mechanosensitive ion channel family protein [Chelatococcus reniformis]|uniref:Mechanosensitive ion channel MscS domain-containing protein n=1 Tax=Chelatococcus reniformis TaxID=1494448 RepID=A0A916X7Z0_9HYPH|nr:mechanosensitive ion channel family protein [Chelatococcus reniformis]GGC49301.1 hypothetical protein GCM10010994_05570 [Chelatococcus reniformis]
MSRQQFDQLVAEVSETVARTLTERGFGPKAPPEATALAHGDGTERLVAQRAAEVVNRLPAVIGAVPALPAQTLRILDRLDRTAAGGRSAVSFLAWLGVACGGLAAVGLGLRHGSRSMRRQLLEPGEGPAPLARVALLAALDLLALALFWLVTHIVLGALFAGAGAQTMVAVLVLDGMAIVASTICLLAICVRPQDPAARIAPVSDADAVRLRHDIVLAVALVTASRAWIAILVPSVVVQAGLLVNAFVVPGCYAVVALHARHAFGAWLAGLAESAAPARAAATPPCTRLWLAITMPVIAILALTRIYGALSGRPEIPVGTITTVATLLGVLLGETLVRYVARHPAAANGRSLLGRLLRPAARLARMAMLLVTLFILAHVWLVDVAGLVAAAEWPAASRTWSRAALILMVALAAWEAVKLFTDKHVTKPGGLPVDEDADAGKSASRLATMMPLLRMAVAIVIAAIALLVALSDLGVNITPLLAGASVFGLALSFGSQTLVRDVVSGIFYLADDAFRVGEYIDCGKAKGTVEGFTLRSIRLRHQNGQVHTIPFGQLGQITNFSRDWTTVKFNLRFARDTDLEKLRKLVKRIGQEMLEDPELKDEFLDPLKMQGVADIADNALIVRFKFTVRPSKPSFVQRQAVRRMVTAFAAGGIEFANATVAVHTIGGPNGAQAGAAAQSMLSRVQAEAAASAAGEAARA